MPPRFMALSMARGVVMTAVMTAFIGAMTADTLHMTRVVGGVGMVGTAEQIQLGSESVLALAECSQRHSYWQ